MSSLCPQARDLLFATVALWLCPDAAATGCPLPDLTAESAHERVETARLFGVASAWSDHARDIEFRFNDNDDPSLPPLIHAARFRVGRNPQRPRSDRCATTFRHRARVPRGPPRLLVLTSTFTQRFLSTADASARRGPS